MIIHENLDNCSHLKDQQQRFKQFGKYALREELEDEEYLEEDNFNKNAMVYSFRNPGHTRALNKNEAPVILFRIHKDLMVYKKTHF
jgi:hypothetical protein